MFKHILVPTDGSKLAAKGAKIGVRLATSLEAKVTAVFVVPPYVPPVMNEGPLYFPTGDPKEYRKAAEQAADKALSVVEREAKAAKLRYIGRLVFAPQPWEGILDTARENKCDLIVMASHGRTGLGGLILGSQTQRVLAHSEKIPVLVTR